jgi:hypothetical protein
MIAFRRGTFVITATILYLGLNGCSSVKIETGQTKEEATESYRQRASTMRSEWAHQVDAAAPVARAELLVSLVQKVAEQYFAFGDEVRYRWQEAEDGRGEEVSAAEMRKMIQLWSETQKPVLKANDDNLEYTRRQIRATNFFDPDFEKQVDGLCDKYYEVYSTIFFPTNDLRQYTDDLSQARLELDNEVDETQDALKPYR